MRCWRLENTGERSPFGHMAFSSEMFQLHNIILIQNWWRTNPPREKGNKICLKAKWSTVDDRSFFYKILLLLKQCILHFKYCEHLLHSWSIKTTTKKHQKWRHTFFFSAKATLIGYTTHPGGSFSVTVAKRCAGIKSVEAERSFLSVVGKQFLGFFQTDVQQLKVSSEVYRATFRTTNQCHTLDFNISPKVRKYPNYLMNFEKNSKRKLASVGIFIHCCCENIWRFFYPSDVVFPRQRDNVAFKRVLCTDSRNIATSLSAHSPYICSH